MSSVHPRIIDQNASLRALQPVALAIASLMRIGSKGSFSTTPTCCRSQTLTPDSAS